MASKLNWIDGPGHSKRLTEAGHYVAEGREDEAGFWVVVLFNLDPEWGPLYEPMTRGDGDTLDAAFFAAFEDASEV